jgi:NADH dehydrogenase
MKTILIVGGGYAGFYTAWGLEKLLRRGEARVVLVDPRGYMTYQPFLPELAAGSIEPRHVAVSLRGHLRTTEVRRGRIVQVRHADRTATFRSPDGEESEIPYDEIVVTAGAVTRTFPIPGLLDSAIGLKHVEEGVAVHERLLESFDRAAALPPGPERERLLTVAVVGGGFSGVELFGELLSLGRALLRSYGELHPAELRFHLVEASARILPEVTDRPGRSVVDELTRRGGVVHLQTQVTSLADGRIALSTGEEFDTGLVVWTAGNAANPVVARHTDLPVDQRGMLQVRADLRVGTSARPVPNAWGAGDDAAVPDIASAIPDARTVPNAQHAVRQGRLLARNLVAVLRGELPREYVHHSLGVVATLGIGHGIFQYKRIVVRGPLAWLMHRGYHVLAIPTWERKVRVLAVWVTAVFFGRDIVTIPALRHPRAAFVARGEVEAH